VKTPEHAESSEFEAFYRVEYPLVVRMTYALTGDLAEAEDIAQETFLRLFLRWEKIQDYDRPAAWVRRVAIHLASSWRRRVSHSLRRSIAKPNTTEAVESSDQELRAAILRLSFMQRAAIVLHYLEDKSIDDVADSLRCASGTVKVHLHRGRQRLALMLGEANHVTGESASDVQGRRPRD
jgi:RNA polymerase sigma-70 factor, ECF subfamily